MTIYIINRRNEVVETISGVAPENAGAIGTARVGLLDLRGDDEAYWTDRLPKDALPCRVERTTYRDENGETVYQIATKSSEVRCEGWLV